MRKVLPFLGLVILIISACSGSSAAYDRGKEMADQTYGAMAPQQMLARQDAMMRKVHSALEQAEDKQEWWNGFCDRGEEIWLERVDQINAAMGQSVLNPDQIKSMFKQMRSSFRE